MRELSFLQLLEMNFNLNGITAVERWWRNGNVNEYPHGRTENILAYTVYGDKLLFTDDDGKPSFSSHSGSVFFIARDCRYTSRIVTRENEMGHTFCVKFRLTDEEGEELLVRERYLYWDCAERKWVTDLFRRIVGEYLKLNVDRARVKSTAYQLLSDLLSLSQNTENVSADYCDILPAVRYIEAHYHSNTSVDELAKMCLMSNSYFRKRFSAYTGGESYTSYRNKLRIKKADELLSDPLWTIHGISEALGFYDTSHFYKIYKKFKGCLPDRDPTRERG